MAALALLLGQRPEKIIDGPAVHRLGEPFTQPQAAVGIVSVWPGRMT